MARDERAYSTTVQTVRANLKRTFYMPTWCLLHELLFPSPNSRDHFQDEIWFPSGILEYRSLLEAPAAHFPNSEITGKGNSCGIFKTECLGIFKCMGFLLATGQLFYGMIVTKHVK